MSDNLKTRIKEIEMRVRKTICPTFSTRDGEAVESLEGRISEQDLETLLLAAQAKSEGPVPDAPKSNSAEEWILYLDYWDIPPNMQAFLACRICEAIEAHMPTAQAQPDPEVCETSGLYSDDTTSVRCDRTDCPAAEPAQGEWDVAERIAAAIDKPMRMALRGDDHYTVVGPKPTDLATNWERVEYDIRENVGAVVRDALAAVRREGMEAGLQSADDAVRNLLLDETNDSRLAGMHMAMRAIRALQRAAIREGGDE